MCEREASHAVCRLCRLLGVRQLQSLDPTCLGAGQNHVRASQMTVYLMKSLQKTLCIRRMYIYLVVANPVCVDSLTTTIDLCNGKMFDCFFAVCVCGCGCVSVGVGVAVAYMCGRVCVCACVHVCGCECVCACRCEWLNCWMFGMLVACILGFLWFYEVKSSTKATSESLSSRMKVP